MKNVNYIKMLKNKKKFESVKQLFLLSICLFFCFFETDVPSLTIQTFLRSQVCPFPKVPVLQAQ